MDLNIFDIIQKPINSEKAYMLNSEMKKLVLVVHPDANRVSIKKAVEAIFGVSVVKVNTQIRKGKGRMIGRRRIERPSKKIAFVTLTNESIVELQNRAMAYENGSAENQQTTV